MFGLFARRARRVARGRRSIVFVEYSSLVLLIAIGAIALLAHFAGVSSH